MPTFQTADNVTIHYEVSGRGRPLLMLPGWSCSIGFFKRNIPALAQDFTVVAMDFRGHGASPDPGHGHRIARYAADVHQLLLALELQEVTLLGWSMGGAVIWSYYEIFGADRVAGFVFVDQSPRQYRSADWTWGSNNLYGAEALAALNVQLAYDPRGVAEGTVRGCYYGEPPQDELDHLVNEIEACPGSVRAAIMSDHTTLDWRDLLPQITVPSLVMVGRHSDIFPWQGSAYVGEQIPNARTEFFEASGHMPFWQESERFNQLVRNFMHNL